MSTTRLPLLLVPSPLCLLDSEEFQGLLLRGASTPLLAATEGLSVILTSCALDLLENSQAGCPLLCHFLTLCTSVAPILGIYFYLNRDFFFFCNVFII